MINRRQFSRSGLAVLLTASALPLSGCGLGGEQFPDYRYCLTVEVDTPEGLKTGYSVIEVSTARAGENSIPTPRLISMRSRGQAVVVDLGKRGLLFAILSNGESSDWANDVMLLLTPPLPEPRKWTDEDVRNWFPKRFAAMLEHREVIEVPRYYPDNGNRDDIPARPLLVRFGDISDPTSVEKVDPDALSASFGEGVKLRRITIQLTEEPVTTGIEKRLVWLGQPNRRRFSADTKPEGIPLGNFSGLFSTEFN